MVRFQFFLSRPDPYFRFGRTSFSDLRVMAVMCASIPGIPFIWLTHVHYHLKLENRPFDQADKE